MKCGKQKDADHFETLMIEAQVVSIGLNETTGVERTSLVLKRRMNVIRVEPEVSQLSTAARLMLTKLGELGEAGFSQWQAACGMTKTTFVRTKNMLVNDGFVLHQIDRYRLSETGTKWYHGGTTVPNGTEATGGTKTGTTTGPRREGPVVPLEPRGTEADSGLPW